MKLLFLSLTLFFLFPAIAQDTKVEEPKEELIKVKISDDISELPQTEIPKVKKPQVEIEVVETIDASAPSSSTPGQVLVVKEQSSTPAPIAEIKPTNPDKNLIIYFVLLLVIVLGIMLLASLVPASSSTRSDK